MHVQDWLDGIPPVAVYLMVGLVVGVESLGIPLPGEIVLMTAALLSSQGHVNPWLVGASAVVGAVAGDSIGYAIGHKGGRPLLDWLGRRFPSHFSPGHIATAERSFDRWGMWAVFFGRFVALLRIFAGPLAGVLKMPYPRFLIANALGGLVWAGGITAIIYYVGVVAEPWLKRFGYIGLAIAVLVGLGSFLYVRRRAAKVQAQLAAEEADREVATAPAGE
ncbi:DedA family protein [Actinacidiphila guanduensis]|uniref:Membrane protein DedA, SNARE-associated domain n=1 Tax=Actinacidiphila guanduensis TaxID=310781 RepID=A0A1H0N0T7_9ACTN|nr:DedA family protein [Actinacidiphila guanduensis]SDO86304.1 membrane protein DedA, SNARE-associated domain [Actinacidiphila guanduensis]